MALTHDRSPFKNMSDMHDHHVRRQRYVPLVLALPLVLTQVGASLVHGRLRRVAGSDIIKRKVLERRQCATVERGGEGGTPGVGDLGVVEFERLQLLQPSSRQRRRIPAGGGGATRAARPSSPSGLRQR